MGQGLFEAKIGSWVLILVASKSIFGERSSFLHKNMKTNSFSFHSIQISCLRDCKSTTNFVPLLDGWQSAKYWIQLLKPIFLGKTVTFKNLLVQNVLIHAAAVEMLYSTFMRIDFESFASNLNPNKTAFNSSRFIWSSFSNVEKSPPVDWDCTTAPQRQGDASVLIQLSEQNIAILLLTWVILSLRYIKLCLASSVRDVLALQLLLCLDNAAVLHFFKAL